MDHLKINNYSTSDIQSASQILATLGWKKINRNDSCQGWARSVDCSAVLSWIHILVVVVNDVIMQITYCEETYCCLLLVQFFK